MTYIILRQIVTGVIATMIWEGGREIALLLMQKGRERIENMQQKETA